MKRKVVRAIPIIAVLLSIMPTVAAAQPAALTVGGGWRWGGSMDSREGEFNMEAGGLVTAELAIRVRSDGNAILHVDYQPSILKLDRYNGVNEELFDMDVWYFMVGGEAEVRGRGRAVPFGVGLLGVAWFNPTGTEAEATSIDSESMFAAIFGGGVRIPFGQDDRIQLQLDGRIHLTIPYGGAGLWCGTGGCSGSFGGTVGPVQGSVSGGLRMALGS